MRYKPATIEEVERGTVEMGPSQRQRKRHPHRKIRMGTMNNGLRNPNNRVKEQLERLGFAWAGYDDKYKIKNMKKVKSN